MKLQFRIEYYDYEDSRKYIAIQIATSRLNATMKFTQRMENREIKILDIKELNHEYYIRKIRNTLNSRERNDIVG